MVVLSVAPSSTRSVSWLVLHAVLLVVPGPELVVPPPLPLLPWPLPPVLLVPVLLAPVLPASVTPGAVLTVPRGTAVGELVPDALVVPDPPDEHPASAAAAMATVAETPETNLILFTGKTPIGVPFSFFRHP